MLAPLGRSSTRRAATTPSGCSSQTLFHPFARPFYGELTLSYLPVLVPRPLTTDIPPVASSSSGALSLSYSRRSSSHPLSPRLLLALARPFLPSLDALSLSAQTYREEGDPGFQPFRSLIRPLALAPFRDSFLPRRALGRLGDERERNFKATARARRWSWIRYPGRVMFRSFFALRNAACARVRACVGSLISKNFHVIDFASSGYSFGKSDFHFYTLSHERLVLF